MTHHTTEQVFGPYGPRADPVRIVVQANGGSVTLSALLTGSTYIPFETISADGADLIGVQGSRIKVTPSGGAEFNWGAGD